MRIDATNNVFVTDDTAQTCVLFGQVDTRKNLQRIDSMQRMVSGKLHLLASATELLPFGDIDAVKGVSFVADKGFDVIFNGGVDIIPFRPADADPDRTVTMRMDADFSAISITNIDASLPLVGTFVVWGDPLPP